jgi:ubiquinone/menaquinone biosynthesis C-methylase UbiE
VTATAPLKACTCCGSRGLVANKVLWPALVQEWGLSDDETQYVDRQQGLQCRRCGSNLRTMALALAICRCYGHSGTFAQFIKEEKTRRLRVLEVNEAGGLTQFLSTLPGHVIGRYPELDMMHMPYPECSYDLVVHSDTLEHVPQPVSALAECYRVLAPGGYCVFTIPVIVDRMTRSRAGLPPSYHGDPNQRAADFAVQTEYGCDAWKQLVLAGFQECRLITPEFPSALAFVGVRWKSHPSPLVLDDNNGERMVPETYGGSTFWEHVYRYAFASRFVAGKRVLDIACGEGYGAAALHKAGAASVIGVDISESVCSHARTKYGLDARQGAAEHIPLPDQSVDVIVSFETIEHVRDPHRFLDECARVLAPGGRLVISTPNKGIYTFVGGVKNPHHCSEMTEEEFSTALKSRFRVSRFYTQHPDFAPWWSVRTFLSDKTPWARIRGFRRLRRAVQLRVSPEAVSDPTDDQRTSILDLIVGLGRKPHEFLNPYALRPRRDWTREKPIYVVATAIR